MILAVNHIEKSYGIDTILENITFHIEEREKTAIVGVNGAGTVSYTHLDVYKRQLPDLRMAYR